MHAATSLPFDSNNLMFRKSVILTEESWLSSNIFVAMVTQWLITVLPSHKWLHLQYFTCNLRLHDAFHWPGQETCQSSTLISFTMPPNFRQSLPKIKIEISAMIARSFALPSPSTIPKQFLSRGGNATIYQLPPYQLHCRRQKNIARVPQLISDGHGIKTNIVFLILN